MHSSANNLHLEGHLRVSEIHTLYYALYGNPKGIPIVVLHGGPGTGCNEWMLQFFDLQIWNVILFDQRGAVRSKPLGCMEENTTQELVSDLEKLRRHLGIQKWGLFGGSWGASLALLYGEEHTDACLGLVLRGVCLLRKEDFLHLFYGMGKQFPEAYDSLLKHIPKGERGDLLGAYYKRLMDPNPSVHMPAARAFMEYDIICSTHLPDPAGVVKALCDDVRTLSTARAFMHYARHNFFIEENQMLINLAKLIRVPAFLVHGRWDAICLPEMAYLLHRAWPNSELQIVPAGGHSPYEPGMREALKASVSSLYLRLQMDPEQYRTRL